MSSSDASRPKSLSPDATALLLHLLLAQSSAVDSSHEADEGGERDHADAIRMPTPVTMPRPTVEVTNNAYALGQSATMTMPNPNIGLSPPSVGTNPTTAAAGPVAGPDSGGTRPPSPTGSDIMAGSLAWQLRRSQLSARLVEKLFGDTRQLPLPIQGRITCLKLCGYGSQNTVENICQLVDFLQRRQWDAQVVDDFIQAMREKPDWPEKLADAPHEAHVKYAWHLLEALLGTFTFKDYTKLAPTYPLTFHGLTQLLFPELPETTHSQLFCSRKRVLKPTRFSFSVRDLIAESIMIEPTNAINDHLKLEGNILKVLIIEQSTLQFLVSFEDNRAARAIGMGSLGNEILQSYGALIQGEFQENFKLPISLGMIKADDESVVPSVIGAYFGHPDLDHRPHLFASRVHAVETALRNRSHWYNRLHRDIQKRKRDEPWMFWGAVLAVFFGICTVIQTVTSVWSLALSS